MTAGMHRKHQHRRNVHIAFDGYIVARLDFTNDPLTGGRIRARYGESSLKRLLTSAYRMSCSRHSA